ncbi:Vacuolar protein sorting-associated protein 26 [Elasticomyces elasticus]|nr:Vacuolar protein sorting-associated protein 26 [Elasticomyces elasticus]
MSLFSFGMPLDIKFVLQDIDDRQTVHVKLVQSRKMKALPFLNGETVKGAVSYNIRHAAFVFQNVEKMYESYSDINVKLRYFVRVTVSRRMADVVREKDLGVYFHRQLPKSNSVIKMDVGIKDCLHIEFEYSKSEYHLKDVIVGSTYFLLVRLKIWHMELSIIGRETAGVPPNLYDESETLVRFEIMDGPPNRGETIPIRHSWAVST